MGSDSMRSTFWRAVVPVAVLAAFVAGSLGGVERARAQTTDAQETVTAYYIALNAGDIDAAAALWSPSIHVVSFGCDLALGRDCEGADEFYAVNVGAADGSFQSTPLEFVTEGETVHVTAEWTSEQLRAGGIERVRQTDSYDVVDGLITKLVVIPDLSDPQSAAFADLVSQLTAPAPAAAGNAGLAVRMPQGQRWPALLVGLTLIGVVAARTATARRQRA